MHNFILSAVKISVLTGDCLFFQFNALKNYLDTERLYDHIKLETETILAFSQKCNGI